MLNDLDINELEWDHDGGYWHSRDNYNITPADMYKYAQKLEIKLQQVQTDLTFSRKMCRTMGITALVKEYDWLRELLRRYEWKGRAGTCPDCGWTAITGHPSTCDLRQAIEDK